MIKLKMPKMPNLGKKAKKAAIITGTLVGMVGAWAVYNQCVAKPETYMEYKIDKFQTEKVIIRNEVVYTIPVAHKGVVLGMDGLWVRLQDPGLNIRAPFEKVYVVNVNKRRKIERGYRTAERGVKSKYEKGDFSEESLMVSGNEGELEVQYAVHFKIKDPIKYLFNVRNPIEILSQAAESAVREIIAKEGYEEALTTGRDKIGLDCTKTGQKTLDNYGIGIDLMAIILQPIKLPTKNVQKAFDDIHKARQEAQSIVQKAEEEYEKAVRKARGTKLKIIDSAKGQAEKSVNEAEGAVAGYLEAYEGYKLAPGPNRKRMHLETIEEFLGNSNLTIIDKRVKGLLPHLDIDKGGAK